MSLRPPFPTRRIRLFLLGYALLWAAALPLVLIYLWRRGRRDALYWQHLGERFGAYGAAPLPGAVWVNASDFTPARCRDRFGCTLSLWANCALPCR